MVAPNTLTRFYSGQSVRLLVGFLAWRELTSNGHVNFRGGHAHAPTARVLAPEEPLRFLRYRDDPRSCLVADATGVAWACPLDFLAPEGAP